MKKNSILGAVLPIMATALVLTACSSEDDLFMESSESTPTAKIIPYTVSVDGGTTTRATVDEDLKTLKFDEGDKLYISGTNISGVMDIQTGTGTTGATFSGSLTYTGDGSPADDLALTATLVSAQQNDGAEVTIAADKTVTVNYGTALCASVNEAVQKYSLLSGTSTFGTKSFTLSQGTAFLNFAITLNHGTSSGAEITATVANVGGSDRTGTVTTETIGGKVVAKFVAPVATQTLSAATVTVGTYPTIYFGQGTTLSAKVYNVARTFHNLRSASATIPSSETWVVYQANNESTTGNYITIGDGGTLILAGVNIYREKTSIACSGDATIIIADGTTNLMDSGYKACCIAVGPAGKKLTIKGEYEGTGIINGEADGYCAGIGAGENGTCGDIEILSGNIIIRGGEYAAGIGTGGADTSPYSTKESICGNISISGGTVHATGGQYGAGIGGGRSLCTSSSVTISGGTVTAIGGIYAAGIGGGGVFRADNSKGVGWGTINITGGTVIATMGGEGTGDFGGVPEVAPYDIGAGGVRRNAGADHTCCGTVTISAEADVTATNGRVQGYPSWANKKGSSATTSGSQEWVQLWAGGPKWAKFNIGSTITSYADVTEYSLATVGGHYSYRGKTDNSADAGAVDDTAKYFWGDNWATPTSAQLQALLDNCTWTLCDGSTVQYEPGCTLVGYKLSGKETGYTGNSIFLPYAGINDQNYQGVSVTGTRGVYWSLTSGGSGAYYLNEGQYGQSVMSHNQPHGCSVRAICVK